MRKTPAIGTVCLALVLVCLFVIGGFPVKAAGGGTRGEQIILIVGGQDKMKTRNPLPSLANDVWTSDVLGRVYDSIGQALPNTEELVPYIIKGIDTDDDGVFEADEYGKFAKQPNKDALNVIAYYDFNGIYFHDGEQATAGDLFFSYQLQAMNPRMNIDLRVLMDKAGKTGSNYSQTRWLFMTPWMKNWQNEPSVGDPNLRVAVRFQLQEPFALFYRSTLTGYTLYPRHVWEGTGKRYDITSQGCSVSNPCEYPNLHTDFGKAIYPEGDSRFGQGIPVSDPNRYKYNEPGTQAPDSAEEWQPKDAEVIGTGPFKFESFDEVRQVALVLKNPYFYTGKDPKTGVMLDQFVATYIHQPYIDGILFNVYGTATMGILALTTGEIDYYHWSVAPEYVPELIKSSEIRIWSRPEPGFFYLAYNMKKWAVGTYNWGQTNQFDIGLHFRKAVAHLIDKATIIKTFLQGYGVPGVVPVSPNNVRFYNGTLTGYTFSQQLARDEIELAHQDALWLAGQPGSPPDTSQWYTWGGDGKLYMPGIGTAQFDLWCPNADYDPVRANSCSMIGSEMNKLGIQVAAKPTAFSTIIQKINARDFDMFILGWRIGGSDPDYLYSFFHSSNAALGQNYPSFNDPTLDWILEQTRKELNETKRVALFRWAEGILADKLPYDVLYYRTNIEAQRQDRFVDWMPSSGTIWNYWSLLNIKPPSNKRLSVGIELPSAMRSGDTKTVAVTVKDQDRNPIDGANVTLELTPDGAGNFTWGAGEKNMTYSGKTSLGRMTVSYAAPTVTSLFNATVTATVTYPDFPEAGKSWLVSVYPTGVNFLAVTVRYLDTDVALASESLRFGLLITTQQGFQKDEANVQITLDPALAAPYGVSPDNGSAGDMTEVTFKAPPASTFTDDENPFTMKVEATSPGYTKGSASVGITVIKSYKSCPDGSRKPTDQECPKVGLPGLEVAATLIIIGSVAVAYAVVRRRKD